MGAGELPEVKPILEINLDSPVVRKFEASEDEAYNAKLASVLLDQAYLAEGIMPSDPAAFAKSISELLA